MLESSKHDVSLRNVSQTKLALILRARFKSLAQARSSAPQPAEKTRIGHNEEGRKVYLQLGIVWDSVLARWYLGMRRVLDIQSGRRWWYTKHPTALRNRGKFGCWLGRVLFVFVDVRF